MRPKKRVLISAEAGTAAVVRNALFLQLRVWGYRVLERVAEGDEQPDAVVAVYPSFEHITLLVNQHWPANVVALVRNDTERVQALQAAAHYAALDMTELRDWLLLATARKRGPKPRSP